RKEYVDFYVNYVFSESIQKPFEDFMQGFLRGCPTRYLEIFFPGELQIVLDGHTKFDWHLLEKVSNTNTAYFCYRTIRKFWAVFHKLPEEKKKMLLAFLSGSDRIPVSGVEHFHFSVVDVQEENPDEACLDANTCSCILFLPR
ncbi:HERC4 ligase, partial [Todus mexicanus]|nr:HERC4 ligase [Todus mexicanus]